MYVFLKWATLPYCAGIDVVWLPLPYKWCMVKCRQAGTGICTSLWWNFIANIILQKFHMCLSCCPNIRLRKLLHLFTINMVLYLLDVSYKIQQHCSMRYFKACGIRSGIMLVWTCRWGAPVVVLNIWNNRRMMCVLILRVECNRTRSNERAAVHFLSQGIRFGCGAAREKRHTYSLVDFCYDLSTTLRRRKTLVAFLKHIRLTQKIWKYRSWRCTGSFLRAGSPYAWAAKCLNLKKNCTRIVINVCIMKDLVGRTQRAACAILQTVQSSENHQGIFMQSIFLPDLNKWSCSFFCLFTTKRSMKFSYFYHNWYQVNSRPCLTLKIKHTFTKNFCVMTNFWSFNLIIFGTVVD